MTDSISSHTYVSNMECSHHNTLYLLFCVDEFREMWEVIGDLSRHVVSSIAVQQV